MIALVGATLLAIVAPAEAFEMSRRDRLAVLYSNQVVFDRAGEPLVSVRITESQDTITLRSAGRFSLLPGGDDATRLTGRRGTTWEIRLEDAKAGVSRYWSVVERLPAYDLGLLADARKRWSDQGHLVKLLESGALIGLAGKTLDTRVVHVGVDARPTEEAANAHAAALAAVAQQTAGRPEMRATVLAEARARPGGWLIARDPRSGFEIRARDLLWLTPEGDAPIELPDMEWGHGTPRRGRADRRYRGDVYVAVGRDGKLAAVNVLSAETLLEGVVPSEIFPSAPAAALRAQAVAARGQLLVKVGTRHRSDPYLLCAETHCQVYKGDGQARKRTTKAIRATRGQLLFAGGRLVDTTYSSSCGGHSEAFHLMWGGPPQSSSSGVHDAEGSNPAPIAPEAVAAFIDEPPAAWCKASGSKAGVFRWTKSITGTEVDRTINRHAGRPLGQIHTITPLRRGVSGRALAIEYVGTQGRHTVEGEYANRKLLNNLRSGMFIVERRGGKPGGRPATWRFRGGGFGHGVGLCQHGSIGMARGGKDHPEILGHYYPGGTLETAW